MIKERVEHGKYRTAPHRPRCASKWINSFNIVAYALLYSFLLTMIIQVKLGPGSSAPVPVLVVLSPAWSFELRLVSCLWVGMDTASCNDVRSIFVIWLSITRDTARTLLLALNLLAIPFMSTPFSLSSNRSLSVQHECRWTTKDYNGFTKETKAKQPTHITSGPGDIGGIGRYTRRRRHKDSPFTHSYNSKLKLITHDS